MCLVSEHDLKQSQNERRPYTMVPSMTSESSLTVDSSGCCKAEFHNIHVEKLQPENGRNAALQKYAFLFRTTVDIQGCHIPLEVLQRLTFYIIF